MKGKKGPVPADLNEPTAEQVVGEENVVDVDGPEIEQEPVALPHLQCAACSFRTHYLSELEEHAAGTGHGRAPVDQVQTELFGTPGVVHKQIQVPIAEEELNEKRKSLASLYQNAVDIRDEKKEADADFNARLKSIDEQMQAISRVLRMPYTYDNVDCEWRIIDGENARGLYRLDTGELVEKQPLTAEDRAAELEKAAEENAEPVSEEVAEEAAVVN